MLGAVCCCALCVRSALLISYGKPLRVAEMNSISNSGRRGVSDAFAAALWTLDGSFEVAQAGGVGVNFHQGAGQNLYAAIIRWYDANNKLLPPQLRPPFYAMLMFQQAVRGGSRLMTQGGLQDVKNGADKLLKVWPLMDANSKELRCVYMCVCCLGLLAGGLCLGKGNWCLCRGLDEDRRLACLWFAVCHAV